MERIFNPKNQKTIRQKLRTNMPLPEILLWHRLKSSQTGYKFRRQQGIGKYVVDFYCPERKLIIEIDGDSHYQSDAQENDLKRDLFFKSVNLQILRFTNNEVDSNIEGVLSLIINTLN
jgi:very-short-patch-repair endonuclease